MEGLQWAAGTYRAARPEQRWGQALFNTLHEHDPQLAAELCGTPADPFYDDARVPAFMDAVSEASRRA